MAKIGFIGVGNMGGPMAVNLIGAGHSVTCHDLSEAAMQKVVAAGAKPAESAIAAIQGAEFICSMLPRGEHVRAVYLGEDGLLANADEGAIFIDCSTIDVATAREVAEAARQRGFAMVDAPVSGGVGGAEAGTLTFMCGATAQAFAKVEPVLAPMAGKVIHAGGCGNGQTAKICNNMVLGVSMIAACEAFVLAENLGLDAQTFFDIISTSSGYCWAINAYCPAPGPVPASPANRDYQAGFSAENMLKDLRLGQAAATDTGVQAHMGEEATGMYHDYAETLGKGGMDFSGIINMIRQRSGA